MNLERNTNVSHISKFFTCVDICFLFRERKRPITFRCIYCTSMFSKFKLFFAMNKHRLCRATAKNRNSASEMHISISKIFYRERFARKLQTRREGLTNREAPSQQLFRGSTSAIYSRLFFCQFNYIDRSYEAAFIANARSWHGCDQRICIRIFASGK